MSLRKCPIQYLTPTTIAFALLFSISALDSLAVEKGPSTKKKAQKAPSLASQVKAAKEDAAKADERARRAEEAAAAAQAEAMKAKSEAAELNKNVSNLNTQLVELEGKLNRALEGQQQKTSLAEQKVTDVSTQVSAVQAESKKAQLSIEEIKKETKGAVTSGNAKMTFYGFVVGSTSFATSQLNISDIPLWAVPRESILLPAAIGGQMASSVRAGGVRETILTARQSRFGFRASLPKSGDWTPSAQFEVDFFGARPAAGQGTVFNQPRIRIGVVTLEHTSGFKLVAGQDWVIFAPLNPTSFAHFAIPEAAAAGNPWMRLPQIRVEKNFKFEEGTSLLIQGGILRAVSGLDSPAPGSLADLPTLSGERAVHPFYQSRIALTVPGAARKPLSIGVSGHYGRQKTTPNTLDSWGTALDYVLPVHEKVGLSGEIWAGSNLAAFQAGILQGVTLTTPDFRFRKINAYGGWLQLAITPVPKWAWNLGYGLDQPRNRDLSFSVNRSKNQIWWTNLLYKIHPNVTVALEYNFFDTIFKVPILDPRRVGTANYVNLAFVYSF